MKNKNGFKIALRRAVGLLLLACFAALPVAYGADEKFWSIQVSSYKTIEEGREDQRRLEIRQFPQVRLEKIPDGVFPFKLLVGRYNRQEDALPTLERIKSLFPAAFRKTFTVTNSASPSKKTVAPIPTTQKTPLPIPQKPLKLLPPALPSQAPSALPVVTQASVAPLISSADSTAISLQDLGYRKEIHLPGAYPEFTYHLLNFEGLVKAEMGVALRFSNVLSEKSAVTVEIDDIPQFTKSIKEIGYAPILPILINPSKGDFTKISIKGHLFITENSCEDIATGNLWMVVSNTTQLVLTGDGSIPQNIATFFKNYESNFNIAFDAEKVSFDALPLFYYLHQLNDWKAINVLLNNKQVDGQKTIRVGRFSHDLEMQKGDLLVYEKGVHLLKKSLVDLYITPSLKEAKIQSEEDQNRGEIRFADLGIEDFTQTGVGDLSLNVPLRYSHFFGIPKNLGLELIVNHTPIPNDDKAFLKIFLNGLLIQTFPLEQGANTRSYHVKIPEALLRSYNNSLQMTASYFPHRAGCGGNDPTMTISISNTSRLYFDGADRKGIVSVTDVMGSLSGNVLLMIDHREMFLPGISLMNLLGEFNTDISRIDVKPWEGKILEGYDFVLLLLRPENTKALDMPLRLDQGRFSIVNPLTQKNALSIETTKAASQREVIGSEYQDGFGALQTFDHGASKVLLLSYYKDAKALAFLKKVDVEHLSRFNGNVVIFNQNSASYTIGEKYRVVYQEAQSVPYYWNRYKLLIVLLSGLIVVLFLYYVNKKLVRE